MIDNCADTGDTLPFRWLAPNVTTANEQLAILRSASQPAQGAPPKPSLATCPDGTRIPASGVCPTIVFPGRSGRDATPPAAPRRSEPPTPLAPAATPPALEPEPVGAVLANLRAAAAANPGRTLSPVMQKLLHPVDLDLDQSAPLDAGTPIRPSLIKRLWDTATHTIERSVHWIPGCRDDLFNRNVCRLSMFGPFYAPGATRDLNDSITEIVEKQLAQ